MVRSIVAVVVTYVVMFVFILAVFSAMWFGLGPNRLMEPGSFKGNMFLCIAAPSLTVVAGLFGGWMCAKIARSGKPVIALAGVVLVLGAITSSMTLQKPEPTGPRDPAMTATELMEKGREPTWLAIFNPIGGAAAVLIGGMFLAGPRKPR
jgi:hypothetical protein